MDLEFIHYAIKDWVYTLVVGFLVVSYWRGTWLLLDIWTCGQPSDATLWEGDTFCFFVPAMEDPEGPYGNLRRQSARVTYGIGLVLLLLGVTMLWAGTWLPRITATPDGTALPGKVTRSLAVARFFIVYCLGASAVCIWHGIWYWADAWILPDKPTASYWTTSLVGSTVAFCMMAGNSILAPPAIFLIDGPGARPPPIAVTLLSSYYSVKLPAEETPPKMPVYVQVVDVVFSFFALPFMVVWFWRGTWLLFDVYFWGLTPDVQDVYVSLGWGTLFFFICIGLTSEPVISLFDRHITSVPVLGALGRFRTWVLALGTVSFWRVVWLVWDEFLPGPTYGSAWLSHAVGVICLTLMGCVSSINAPASTMGVDCVPHPKCADEPLFAMIPIPFDLLYFCGIGRQEWAKKEEGEEAPEEPEKFAENEEVELTPVGEGEKPTAAAPRPTSSMLESLRSWRAGLGERATTYHDLQRPGLGERTCSEYAQRPSLQNKRSRSKFFRSR